MFEAFFLSTAVVALAEMGDKTQLLALVLAARFRKPWPIVWGILVATLLNHGIAAALGAWLTTVMSAQTLRWVLGGSFVAMAAWIMVPDKLDEDDANVKPVAHWGIFGTTLLAFFLAEMGDKTQIATVGLAAKFHDFYAVVAGTTAGMMLANVPAVIVGNKLADRIPMRLVHGIAALIFLALGIVTLTGWLG
jgi:putative Ca2+/H+ antiporter (TMEM165/GDT1 family)